MGSHCSEVDKSRRSTANAEAWCNHVAVPGVVLYFPPAPMLWFEAGCTTVIVSQAQGNELTAWRQTGMRAVRLRHA